MFGTMYRILAGVHNETVVSYLSLGYTITFLEFCFGLLKYHFRRCKMGCFGDIDKAIIE